MHDARPLDAADAGKPALAVVEQRVDQRAVRISRCGMHDHARRFVEHDEVIVLEKNFQRDVLRRVVQRHGLGQGDGDEVAGFHRIPGFRGLAVDDDELVADERLDARAREVRQTGGKERIKAFAGGIGMNFHARESLRGKKMPQVSSLHCVAAYR